MEVLESIVQFDNTAIDPAPLHADTRDRASVPVNQPGNDTSSKATTENPPQVVPEIYGPTNKDKTINGDPLNRLIPCHYRETTPSNHHLYFFKGATLFDSLVRE